MVHYLFTSKLMMKKEPKQTTVDRFLKRVAPSQEEPQAGPLGGIPKGIVIIRGDIHKSSIAPCMSLSLKFFQWNKM